MINAYKQEQRSWVSIITSKRIQKIGGCRIAQEAGAIYAKELLEEDRKSAAYCIQKGFELGKQMIDNGVISNVFTINQPDRNNHIIR